MIRTSLISPLGRGALAAALLAAALPAAAQVVGRARVCLEQDKLELKDGDRVLAARFVSRGGPDRKAALDDAKARVLKRMELRSEAEMEAKGLKPVFDAEMAKTAKFTKLAEPRLRFYGADGKVIKELPLGVAMNSSSEAGPGGKSVTVSLSLTRDAFVSDDQQYALLYEDYSEYGSAPSSTGKATYYAADGRVLWEKRYPKYNICVGMPSPDGGLVFLTDWWRHNPEPRPADEPAQRLTVYDRAGKKVLSFPRDAAQAGGCRLGGNVTASPKGRYAALRADKNGGTAWIFLDIPGKSFFIYDETRLEVSSVSDSGFCVLSYSSGVQALTLDLKKKKFTPIE